MPFSIFFIFLFYLMTFHVALMLFNVVHNVLHHSISNCGVVMHDIVVQKGISKCKLSNCFLRISMQS